MSLSFKLDYSQDEYSLKPYLIKAIIFHVLLVLIAFIINLIWGLNLFDFARSKSDVEIIQSAVRVDVVGMPKFTIQELKKLEVAPVTKGVEEAKPEPVAPAKEDVADTSFSSFLSDYSKKKVKTAPKQKAQGNESAIDQAKLKSLVIEGNKVAEGTSLVGDSLKQEMTAYTAYVGNLPNLVRPHWKLPTYLMDKDLKARVRVFISSTGEVIKTEIYQSSGTSEFDQRALRAVNAAAPFPVPTNEIRTRLSSGDVILGFPL